MILINYLIKTIIISGVLFGYYSLFLKNRRFHGYNRIFLLSAILISLILPLLQLKIPGFLNPPSNNGAIRILGVGAGNLNESMTGYIPETFSTGTILKWVLSGILLSIMLILINRFIKSLIYINNLRNRYPVEFLSEARLYFTTEKGTPFSFFKNIFWDNHIDLNSKEGTQILSHELYHVKSRHSFDNLFAEISCIVFWINPFFHLIRRELKAVHEYSADAYASENFDVYDYARLLLSKPGALSFAASNPFFNSQIKRRITMITKNKSFRSSGLTRMLAIPFFALLVCLFGFQKNRHSNFTGSDNSLIRVVVDAGHGGAYDGTTFQNVQEKNINLSIAKKIQELANNYNIDVILSRDKDETPGSSDLRKSLEYIASLPGKNQADLFVSIHTNRLSEEGNNFQTSQSGFEIYVPRQTNNVYSNSVKLASSITASIKPDYTIATELKQRDKGVYILDKATVPAVIIECGYMDNQTDFKNMQDEKHQEKIARDILEGIRRYSEQTASLQ